MQVPLQNPLGRYVRKGSSISVSICNDYEFTVSVMLGDPRDGNSHFAYSLLKRLCEDIGNTLNKYI